MSKLGFEISNDILLEISKIDKDLLESTSRSHFRNGYGIYTGDSGKFIFLAHNYLFSKDIKYLNLLNKLVYSSIINLNTYTHTPIDYTFASGLAGWGWALDYISQKNLLEYDVSSILQDLDFVMIKQLKHFLGNHNLDQLYGALGLAKYFLQRKNNLQLEIILDYLDKNKIKLDNLICWKTKKNDIEVYDFGLSHGMSGIIYFLSKCSIQLPNNLNCLNLLRGSVAFVLEHFQLGNQNSSCFPNIIEVEKYSSESVQNDRTRLGWCYGDLIILYNLFNTNGVTETKIRKSLIIDSLVQTSKRLSYDTTLVVDPSFCHGSIGCAYIYFKLWKKTKILSFKKAGEYWLNFTISFNKEYEGVQGYLYLMGNYSERSFQKSCNLLEGNIALSLVYLTIINDMQDDDWDSVFMLD